MKGWATNNPQTPHGKEWDERHDGCCVLNWTVFLDDESKKWSSKHIAILTMNVYFLNWMTMKISTWSGSCDGQKPLKIFKSSTNSPIKIRQGVASGSKKQQKIIHLNQIPIQLVVLQNRFLQFFTHLLPQLAFLQEVSGALQRRHLSRFLTWVGISTRRGRVFDFKSPFWGVFRGSESCDRNCWNPRNIKKRWVSSFKL